MKSLSLFLCFGLFSQFIYILSVYSAKNKSFFNNKTIRSQNTLLSQHKKCSPHIKRLRNKIQSKLLVNIKTQILDISVFKVKNDNTCVELGLDTKIPSSSIDYPNNSSELTDKNTIQLEIMDNFLLNNFDPLSKHFFNLINDILYNKFHRFHSFYQIHYKKLLNYSINKNISLESLRLLNRNFAIQDPFKLLEECYVLRYLYKILLDDEKNVFKMLFFGKYNLNDYFSFLDNLQESLYFEIDKFISLVMFFTNNKLSFNPNTNISDLSNLINNKSMSSYFKFLDSNLEKINFFGYGLNQFQINKIYIIIHIMIARSVYYLKDLFNLIVSDTELLDKNYRLENPVFLKEILIQKMLLSYIYVCIGKYDEANKIKIDCIIHIEAFKYNCCSEISTKCSFDNVINLNTKMYEN